jgi:hypothetical protein
MPPSALLLLPLLLPLPPSQLPPLPLPSPRPPFLPLLPPVYWLIVVCPSCCLCFCHRCLPSPLPLLVADVIGGGDDFGNGCGRNSRSGDCGT